MDKDQLAAMDRAAREAEEQGPEQEFAHYQRLAAMLIHTYRTGKLVLIDDGAVEALREARRIIADIDDYMKRPERGDWGAECACCMGELLDDDRAAIARIDAALSALGMK